MTLAELRARYTEAVAKARAHRKFWAEVANQGQPAAVAKMSEIDTVLDVLRELKDELKARLEYEEMVESAPVQPTLLDVPKRAEYR